MSFTEDDMLMIPLRTANRWLLTGVLFLVAAPVPSLAQAPSNRIKPDWSATPTTIRPAQGKTSTVNVVLYYNACQREAEAGKPKNVLDTTHTFKVLASGSGATASAPTVGDCTVITTLSVDGSAAEPGGLLLMVTEAATSAGPFADRGVGVVSLMDNTAGLIPPGLAPQVDVIWEVMSQDNCSDVFGRRVSQTEYCIQVKIGNNSGYPLQIAGMGFSSKIENLPDTPQVTIANSSYASTRAVLIKENVTNFRNVLYNSLQAAGVLMAGFTPFFHNVSHQGNWTAAAAIVSGPLLQGFGIVAPNPVIAQLNNLDDQSFRDTRIIANNSQIQTVVFIEKRALTIQLTNYGLKLVGYAETAKKLAQSKDVKLTSQQIATITALTDGLASKSSETVRNSTNPDTFRPFTKGKGTFDPLLVKLALGDLVIVGDQIAYLQRVQIQSNATTTAKSGPNITSLSHTTGAPGDSITIAGANFGATQGSSMVKFGTGSTPVATIAASDWSDQSITVTVPNLQPGDVNVVVSVGGTDSAPAKFTVLGPTLIPTISNLSSKTGAPGDSVVITGVNFGKTPGKVKFGTTDVGSIPAASWSETKITVSVPTVQPGNNDVVVTVGGTDSVPAKFTVPSPAPAITNLSSKTGAPGDSITINGTNFGATQGASKVEFNTTPVASIPAAAWSDKKITVSVPNLKAGPGKVAVTVGGTSSTPSDFTVTTTK